MIYIAIDARKSDVSGKVVVCIPVYGQSLALGEEAERITDFDKLVEQSHDRIVTENIDNKFGYFDGSPLKQYLKRLFHYRKRSFELSVYGMAESLTQQLGADTVICTFPGGQGATALAQLSKATDPYNRFIDDIAKAYRLAQKGDCKRFYVPAVCFLQGESDIADYPDTDYTQLLLQFKEDINRDIKAITRQTEDVRIITYQANDGSGNSFLQKYDKDPSGTPVSVTLAANPFSRDYYEFVSWNTKADGLGSSYRPQDVLDVTENITLYAIWKPVEYSITYSLNGGILDQENPASYTVETESFTLNNPHGFLTARSL